MSVCLVRSYEIIHLSYLFVEFFLYLSLKILGKDLYYIGSGFCCRFLYCKRCWLKGTCIQPGICSLVQWVFAVSWPSTHTTSLKVYHLARFFGGQCRLSVELGTQFSLRRKIIRATNVIIICMHSSFTWNHAGINECFVCVIFHFVWTLYVGDVL